MKGSYQRQASQDEKKKGEWRIRRERKAMKKEMETHPHCPWQRNRPRAGR